MRKKHTCSCCGSTYVKDDVTYKEAKTIKEYTVRNYKGYGLLVVPVGSTVYNKTACGNDDNYHFWKDFHKVAEEVSGFKNSLLHHDLTYSGLNIPAEYCEPYPER